MAWVTQRFTSGSVEVSLEEAWVRIYRRGSTFVMYPTTRDEAHDWALMLRRAARRLEEIGKSLG